MRLPTRSLLFLLAICLFSSAHAQLVVTNSTNAVALAQKLVGSGVTISNVSITASSTSTGFFNNLNGNQLSLDSGIVLTTGRAQTIGGGWGVSGAPVALASTTIGTNGDADLATLTSPNLTYDAAVLEFDFVPIGDTIKFNYVFSSEEYPDFVCTSWNDIFAFFISGPGIVGKKNLALVPGSNIPVTINSINSGIPGSAGGSSANCTIMGPGSPFTQYYTNNSTGSTFTHNGHTKVLTALAAVVPCQVYHLKIAIADVSDGAYDSGVFLEAGSLTSDPVKIVSSLPVINGLPYMVEGCQSAGVEILRSRKTPLPMIINLSFGGTAIVGTDVQPIPTTVTIPANDSLVLVPVVPIIDNITEGTDTLKIYVSNGCSLASNYYLDSIIILLRDYDTLSVSPHDTVVCKNASVQLSATGNFTTVQWTPSAGLTNASIANPIATASATTTYIVTSGIGTCLAKDSVQLRVKRLQLLSKTDVLCKDGTTGQIKVSGANSGWKVPLQFNINSAAFVADSTFSNLAVGSYTVRIKDATGCIDSVEVSIEQSSPDLLLSDSLVTASCSGQNGQIFLSGSGGLAPYTFSADNGPFAAPSNFNVSGGTHISAVKDANGCITTRNSVITNDPPIVLTTTPSPALCNGLPSGYLHINASGGTTHYQYSSDGTNFQSADSLLVSTASVNVTVKDEKGCTASAVVAIPINQPVFVNAGKDTTICEGKSVQFNTTYNAASFAWTSDPSLSSTTIANPVATPVTTTVYYVTGTKGVCVARDTITVAVNAAPIPNAGRDSIICFGKSIQLQPSGGVIYDWSPTTGFVNTIGSNPLIQPVSTTTYYLEVTDANGCRSLKKDTVVITVTPPMQVSAGADTLVVVGQPLQLNGIDFSNLGSNSFLWTPATGLSSATVLNPVATLSGDITYTLTISTPEGCQGSDKITIKVFSNSEIYVPTAFTPNGDGKNDLLKAFPVGLKQFNYFKVFNRWGQMIFSTSNARSGWDGTISGAKQSTGSYVWMAEGVDFSGNKIVRKGTTTLIR